MTPDQSREYDITAECFRHHQTLIHHSIATYVVFAVPLAGVTIAASVAMPLKIMAAVVGAILSAIWYLITKRMSIFNTSYIDRLKFLEGNYDGFISKDDDLKKTDPWLRIFPGTTRLITTTFFSCFIFFVTTFVYLLAVKQ